MTRIVRLAVVLLPLAASLAASVPQGRAQDDGGRFAFADTTLLRDTLDLRFDGLFRLADSLQITPDTLRAWSIRWRWPLARFVVLADSLGVPVDSVGPVMWRERFNPLANRAQRVTQLNWVSGYSLQQTSSSWTNSSDWNLVRDRLFLRNNTTVVMDRYKAGGETNLRQTRSSATEGGYRLAKDFSLGARLNLERFDSSNPGGSLNDEAESKNELQLSTRSKQRFGRAWQTELNAFTGVLDLENSLQVKRGLSGDVGGRVRYDQRGWLTNDVSARFTGNLARTRVPTAVERLNTNDFASNLDGTMQVLPNRPLSANLAYVIRQSRVETPLDSARLQTVRTVNNSVNLSLRWRRDNDRTLTVTPRWSTNRQATASRLSSLSTREDRSVNVAARWRLAGWNLDGSFDAGTGNSEFPQRSAAGGYGDDSRSRNVNGVLTRPFGPRLTLKAEGRVNLVASRYYRIGAYPNPPVNRDQYRQSYRLEGLYQRSERFSSGAALEVQRNRLINLPSASTAANNETRTYRAEWRWSYRMLPGLTATQLNQMNADYVFFNFVRTNNRLAMDFRVLTTLNAVLSPRTNLELTHDVRLQPAGSYAPLPDGIEYFSEADEGRNYTLRARLGYTPSPVFSLNLQSEFLELGRFNVVDGGDLPQRESRTLNFSGGTTLNLPLGSRGRLTGDLRRTYRADRTTTYVNGDPRPSPRSQFDFWVGRMELSWAL